jgi:hypothetical protein
MGREALADHLALCTSHREDADLDRDLPVFTLVSDDPLVYIPADKVARKEIILQADVVDQTEYGASRRDAICPHERAERGDIGLLEFAADDESLNACPKHTANLEPVFIHLNFLFPWRVNVL